MLRAENTEVRHRRKEPRPRASLGRFRCRPTLGLAHAGRRADFGLG